MSAAVGTMALGRLQALVAERHGLDERIREALSAVLDAGVAASVVASALGVHRSTVYRMLERGA